MGQINWKPSEASYSWVHGDREADPFIRRAAIRVHAHRMKHAAMGCDTAGVELLMRCLVSDPESREPANPPAPRSGPRG